MTNATRLETMTAIQARILPRKRLTSPSISLTFSCDENDRECKKGIVACIRSIKPLAFNLRHLEAEDVRVETSNLGSSELKKVKRSEELMSRIRSEASFHLPSSVKTTKKGWIGFLHQVGQGPGSPVVDAIVSRRILARSSTIRKSYEVNDDAYLSSSRIA